MRTLRLYLFGLLLLCASVFGQTRIRDLPIASPVSTDIFAFDASGGGTWGTTLAGLLSSTVPSNRTITCTAPLLCAGGTSTTLAADFTLSITPGVFALIAHGSSSHTGNIFPAADTGHALNGGWLDVSANTLGGHPIAGWRRLAVNPGTGELSVENSLSAYISLENHVPTPIAEGGTGTMSTLTGLVRGNSSAMTAAELSGDATTSGSNVVTVSKLNGVSLAGLATGLLKNTTATGVPSIAGSSDVIALLGANSITDAMVVSDITVNSSHSITTSASLGVGSGGTSPDSPIEVSLNTASLPIPPTGTMIHTGQVDGTNNRTALDSFGAGISTVDLEHQTGTAATGVVEASGQPLGQLNWRGYDSTGITSASRIQAITDETWSSSAHGTHLSFYTTPATTTTITEYLRIENSGHITPLGTTPTVACTGTGTSPAAPTIDAGGTDTKWTITMNTGTGSPGNTGTCTITFAKAFVTNKPVMVCMLVDGASAWANEADVRLSTQSLTAPVVTWTNEASGVLTGLATSTSYKISCIALQ